MLSRTMSCPRRRRRRTASTAERMYERSGVLVLLSGVGTQMRMASMPASSSKSPLGRKRPAWSAARRSSSSTSTRYDRPSASAASRVWSMSNPVTWNPACASSRASTSPTYPRPITPIVASPVAMRSSVVFVTTPSTGRGSVIEARSRSSERNGPHGGWHSSLIDRASLYGARCLFPWLSVDFVSIRYGRSTRPVPRVCGTIHLPSHIGQTRRQVERISGAQR